MRGWLPFLGLLLTFIAAMLVSNGGLITTIIIVGVSTWLTLGGMRAYPLPDLFVTFLLVVGHYAIYRPGVDLEYEPASQSVAGTGRGSTT
jgi:hypothetical protein